MKFGESLATSAAATGNFDLSTWADAVSKTGGALVLANGITCIVPGTGQTEVGHVVNAGSHIQWWTSKKGSSKSHLEHSI